MTTPTLWVDQYRPSEIEDYVWRDPVMRDKVAEWLETGAIPHLILSGKSGLGKTSLAKMMLKLLKVPKGDILEINASKARKIDQVEEVVMGFCSTYTMIDNEHGFKYVLFDEADSMSLLSQKFLRAEIENHSDYVRFIFTCNYIEKINNAIASRCQHFHFEALGQEEFVLRLSTILEQERVKYELDDLVVFIEKSYPDLRKCINMLQQSTINGVLRPLGDNEGKGFDYILEISELFATGQHKIAREFIVEHVNVDEYPEIFRFMYQNLEFWGSTNDKQDDALIIIRDGLYRHSIVADPEINLAATLAELGRLKKS